MGCITRRKFGKLVSFAAVAGAAGLAFKPSTAAAAVDISRKVKLAGDLRTFTQRMALAVAFVKKGVDAEHFLEVLREEYGYFAADIEVLRNGDPQYALGPETNKLVNEAINTVEFGWKVLGPALKTVIDAGSVDDAQFKKIEKVNGQILPLADSLLHRIMTEYQASLPLELSYQIDVAGAQKMLSQKIIKEALLVAYGHEAEAHRTMLEGSVQLFAFGFDKLRGEMLHNEVTLPQPPAPVLAKLAEGEALWAETQTALASLEAAGTPDAALLRELAHEADTLCKIFEGIIAHFIKQAENV